MDIWEEFKRKYVQPRVEKVIVGFSGLDPDEVELTLTDEQFELVKSFFQSYIQEYIQKVTIRIDSGSLDPDEPPPEAQPVTLKPSEIPHEMLDGLLGGADNEHYHLALEEYNQLKEVLQIKHEEDESGETFYKLTKEQYNKLIHILEEVYPDIDYDEPVFIDEEFINELIDARIKEYIRNINGGEVKPSDD